MASARALKDIDEYARSDCLVCGARRAKPTKRPYLCSDECRRKRRNQRQMMYHRGLPVPAGYEPYKRGPKPVPCAICGKPTIKLTKASWSGDPTVATCSRKCGGKLKSAWRGSRLFYRCHMCQQCLYHTNFWNDSSRSSGKCSKCRKCHSAARRGRVFGNYERDIVLGFKRLDCWRLE